ncbi:MAG: bifunctional diaminohydroxyphosphoribosylaminopyrimidine deaminase/5-amino-6-(5-phosphoribosylamino)uracil reductase RibD [bacterium]
MASSRENDHQIMGEALALAARATGRTSPNPMVGAIVVDPQGNITGRGWHERAGSPHAEALALREAGEGARGGTLFLTLEPCAHQGKTPPCAPAVVEAGISRVVAASGDPDPRVSGKGFQVLREGGVSVEVGLRAEEAVRLNEAFFVSVKEGRPFVTLKVAMSLDGKIAARPGGDRWITSPESRARAHEFRDRVDAILVGVETILKDDPLLTARPEGREGKPLIRVVLDSRLRTPREARSLPPDRGVATIIAATERIGPESGKELARAGAEVVRLPPDSQGRVALPPLLEELGKRGVRHLLVEGGANVHASFLKENLADKLMAFVAPMIIGDEGAPGAISGAEIDRMEADSRLVYVSHQRIDDDLLIEGYLRPPPWADAKEIPGV